MNLARGMLLTAAAVLMAGCKGSTDITVESLEGVWDATAYVYTNAANSSQQVNIVTVHGATMVVTVQASGTTSSVFVDGQGGTSSDSGQFTATDNRLTLAGVTYQASKNGNLLTLTATNGQYDFDGNGSKEAANVTITLRRR